VHVVGDLMVDVALRWQELAKANGAALEAYNLETQRYVLLTAHRAANVDSPERLQALVELVKVLAEGSSVGDVVFPVHPRTRERLREAGLLAGLGQVAGVQLTDPLPYAAFSALLCHAQAVLTDSGGVQKEAYLAGVPCLTLRETTEWVETVQSGWNTLVDLDSDAALRALRSARPRERPPLYGDGHAAARCVEAIDAFARELGREPGSQGPHTPGSSLSAP
jgi:UDP-N-acetylglucosamine 2-epimerase (non-hydrolysing)/UDP-GlcNAc3NAcA epimerase